MLSNVTISTLFTATTSNSLCNVNIISAYGSYRPFSRWRMVPAYPLLPGRSQIIATRHLRVKLFVYSSLKIDANDKFSKYTVPTLKEYLQERGVTVTGYRRALVVEFANAFD